LGSDSEEVTVICAGIRGNCAQYGASKEYRYKVLTGEIAERVRELVRDTCEAFEIRIVKGVVSKDHVHILTSCPPTMAPSEIMRRIKGRTSSKPLEGKDSPPQKISLQQ
jgi:putative transposase